MEKLNYEVLKKSGYTGYVLESAPEKILQFGEGNFLRAFVDYWFDMANEKVGWNGKAVLVQPIAMGLAKLINEQQGLYTLYLRGRENGETRPAIAATVSGMTTVDAERFDLNATAAITIDKAGELVADVTVEQADYEEIAFEGGQAIDLRALDDTAKDTIKGEIKTQAAKLALQLVTKPDVLANLMTIFGKLAL